MAACVAPVGSRSTVEPDNPGEEPLFEPVISNAPEPEKTATPQVPEDEKLEQLKMV
jgi:hypothetical protein